MKTAIRNVYISHISKIQGKREREKGKQYIHLSSTKEWQRRFSIESNTWDQQKEHANMNIKINRNLKCSFHTYAHILSEQVATKRERDRGSRKISIQPKIRFNPIWYADAQTALTTFWQTAATLSRRKKKCNIVIFFEGKNYRYRLFFHLFLWASCFTSFFPTIFPFCFSISVVGGFACI